MTPNKGWHNNLDPNLATYYSQKNELTIYDGCLIWGIRGIIPNKLRTKVLSELLEGHRGVVKMKSLACSFAWWPGIDHDIEQLAKGYTGWQQVQHNPAQAPLHTWKWPAKPWQRIHIDYAGPFLGHMFLVVVDAHSKWPEVILTEATTSSQTIDTLRTIFAPTTCE